MKIFRKRNKEDELQEVIDELIQELKLHDTYSDEYTKAVDNLVKLDDVHRHKKLNHPSSDVLFTAGANLVGILLILNHEKANVITSKAVSLLLRPRI